MSARSVVGEAGTQAEERGILDKPLRIGELAELAGTTPRTIRYYEEIGLLGSTEDRAQGKHRLYTRADLDRVTEIIRLRDLLGLSLEQLSQLLEAQAARAEIRREYRQSADPATGGACWLRRSAT